MAAPGIGLILANEINQYQYQYIHLIAHSAGARLIDETSKDITTKNSKRIHLTFLDAFTPNFYDDYGASLTTSGYLWYYVEHYVDKGLVETDTDLPHAYNFDITNWMPITPYDKHDFGHHWPRYWYDQSVTMPKEYGFGYNLSLEGYGSLDRMNNITMYWDHSPDACELKDITSELPSSCDFKDLSPTPAPTPTPPKP